MRPAASAWIALAIVLVVAPGVLGVASRTRALLTRRRGAPVLQSYYDLLKLLRRGSVLSDTTSRVFRAAPVCLVASTLLAGAVIPLDGRAALIRFPGDVVALVYALAFGRFLLVLAALDTGSSFEGMGASREVTVASIVELGLFLSFGTLAALTKTSSLSGMLGAPLAAAWPTGSPAILMTAVGLFALMLAECARVPVDDPATHLELTMIHEAMLLEYSARHLALLEWASALKLFNYSCIGLALFVPFGVAEGANALAIIAAAPALIAKLAIGGAALALIETLSAKLRIFRAPEFLGTAFLLAVLGMLVKLLLGS